MDRREQHLLSLGICQRLYNLIMRRLASQASKTVILGPPVNQAVHGEARTKRDRKVHPEAESSKSVDDPSVDADANNDSYAEHEVPTVARQAKPPKKTVSISDNVEDMEKAMKLRRKSRSFEKLNWLELAKEDPKPKPLRSILKVGSDLSKQMASFVNHNHMNELKTQ